MNQNENAKLIVQLGNAMVKKRNAKTAEFGLTSGQASILRFLFKHQDSGEINQNDIQTDLCLSHQTVTGMISRLEKKGYVFCEQSCRDKRCKQIKLTPKAFELKIALKELADASEHIIIQNMTEKEQLEFNRLLRIAHINMTGE